MLDDPRCRRAPYLASGGWIVLDFDTAKLDWEEVRELVTSSYRLIAPKTLAAKIQKRLLGESIRELRLGSQLLELGGRVDCGLQRLGRRGGCG